MLGFAETLSFMSVSLNKSRDLDQNYSDFISEKNMETYKYKNN